MNIIYNTDKNLSLHETFGTQLDDLLSDKLSRFSESITRLEVHLSDVNGQKNSPNDRKCVLEAHVKGFQPVAVTEMGNSHELSVNGAIVKLKALLTTKLGKLKNH